MVTGPPCAGKSSHVQAHAATGDVVIDLDQLARALGSDHDHTHPPAVLRVARAARHAAIAAAIREHRRGAAVWVVDALPSAGRRQVYNDAAARYVHLDPGRAELHRRATAAGRPDWTHRQIDRWPGPDTTPTPVTSRPW